MEETAHTLQEVTAELILEEVVAAAPTTTQTTKEEKAVQEL